ncbi:hypothetical protein TNCV_302331 [Trichonephila clavipes]|nr:hypothetical protein TNCV_302331 [Trichonephila clavipes]
MAAQVKICKWSNHRTRREMGFLGINAIDLGEQHCPEYSSTYQNACFHQQELWDSGQTVKKIPIIDTIYQSPHTRRESTKSGRVHPGLPYCIAIFIQTFHKSIVQ